MNKNIYCLYGLLAVSGIVPLSVYGAQSDVKQAHARVGGEQQAEPKGRVQRKKPKKIHARRHSIGATYQEQEASTVIIPGKPETDINPEYLRSSQKQDTLLVRAIRKLDQNEVERLLLKERVSAGVQNNRGQTALMLAVDYGNLYAETLLMHEHPETINLQDVHGDTALIYAIRVADHPIVKLLLGSGADPLLTNRERQTALMIAARHNDTQSIRLILNTLNAANRTHALSQEDRYGNSAVQIAQQAHAQEAEGVLLEGLRVDDDILHLINAATTGDVETVDALVKKKVDVNCQYASQTPLIAAVHGDALPAMLAIVTKLLTAGANPNVLDVHSRTPLAIVAGRHFDEAWEIRMKDAPVFSDMQCKVIETLLNAGANIEGRVADVLTSKRHSTPLIDALMNLNPDVAELLIARGANIKAQYKGKTVDEYVRDVFKIIKKHHASYDQWVDIQFEVKKKLMEGARTVGPQESLLDPQESLLIESARAGDAKTVEALLAQKVNVNCVHYGQTPLTVAVQGKNAKRVLETVTVLVKAGANPNILNAAGNSALALVAARHFDPQWRIDSADNSELHDLQLKIIDALLAGGRGGKANINGGEMPPIISALANYNVVIASVLMVRGANLEAQYKGETVSNYIQEALDTIIKPQYPMYEGWITMKLAVAIELSPLNDTLEGALLQSVNFKNEKRVAELLAADKKPNLNVVFYLNTPLILAIERNSIGIMQQLIQAHADINGANDEGQTPLMVALFKNYREPVRLLLEHRVDVHALDNIMNTCLMYFALSTLNDPAADIEILKMLLGRGVSVLVRNVHGDSALDIVEANQSADPKIKAQVIQILQEAEKLEIAAQKTQQKQ